MRYISSRGSAPKLNFNEVLLTGLARDKGLYIPESWPEFSLREISSWRGLSYPELAEKIIKPFVGDCISDTVLKSLISSAYSSFNNSQIAPLNLLESGIWVMELFHGPTMSFKDIAMQFLGKTFDHVLQEREETITIIGATSGDTGSAAIAACSNKPSIELFMLHPLGRISEIQRRQMTTMLSSNIHNIALIGTFDDCQDRVKDLFNDMLFRDRWHLSAVNSINWGRIMAQIVYYFWGALKVGGPEIPVAFSIPTGNFGNIFAGYSAYRMGLPIANLITASNQNDILTRFFETGSMEITAVKPTISPSMDIQVSSNFERLLFELVGRDGSRVNRIMTQFRQKGAFHLSNKLLNNAKELFGAARFDDAATLEVMAQEHARSKTFFDPHSAIGLAAARKVDSKNNVPTIVLATAHPAKFPEPVFSATGLKPKLPSMFKTLLKDPERFETIENDLIAIKKHIETVMEVSRAK